MESLEKKLCRIVFEEDVRECVDSAKELLDELYSNKTESIEYLVNGNKIFEVVEVSFKGINRSVYYEGRSILTEDMIKYLRTKLINAQQFIWNQRLKNRQKLQSISATTPLAQ